MIRETIGETAGRLWKTLGNKEAVGLSQLPKILKEKSDVAYQALGWLAREDKISYHTKDGKVYISLSDREKELFKSHN